MARTKSSGKWLAEHFSDPYVKRAHKEGFRSRAVYKLMEIDERDHVLAPGMIVVDLGAAPGGWCQYARTRIGSNGVLVALDILPMEPLAGVTILTGDFSQEQAVVRLREAIGGRPVDLVMCDLAPNTSGVASVDQARATGLVEAALWFAAEVLRPGGLFLAKVFEGAGVPELRRDLQARFEKLHNRKPKASRPRSRELYLLASGFRGPQA